MSKCQTRRQRKLIPMCTVRVADISQLLSQLSGTKLKNLVEQSAQTPGTSFIEVYFGATTDQCWAERENISSRFKLVLGPTVRATAFKSNFGTFSNPPSERAGGRRGVREGGAWGCDIVQLSALSIMIFFVSARTNKRHHHHQVKQTILGTATNGVVVLHSAEVILVSARTNK